MGTNQDHKYKIEELIDIEHFQNLQDRLNEIYSFPSSIIDNDGNILTTTGWQEICHNFHRKNKECEKACIQSDKYILEHLDEANPAVTYRCPHGLVDNATPIIIDDVHYGNFFTGQFFLEEPDMDFFRSQAKKYGFPEDPYLEAVKKVPVWNMKQLNDYLFYIKELIAIISESGLKNLKEIEIRKQIEESQKRYRSILETATDGFWLLDKQGHILEVNEAYCKMSGYSHQELLKMGISDLEANESSEEITQQIQEAINEGESRFVRKHRQKDGSLFEVELSTQYQPKEERFVCFLRDITELRKTEEALKESEERLGLALKFANDGLFDWNLETNEIFYSPVWKSLLGYENHEIKNDYSEWERFTKSEDVETALKILNEVLEGKRDRYETEFQMRHKDGHWVDILSRANIIFNEEGKGIRVVGTHVDISKRKRIEKELKKSERLHREAQQVAKIGHWELNPEIGTQVWSDEIFRIFGLDPQMGEPSFTDHETNIHPDDWPILNKAVSEAGSEGTPYDITFRLVRPDGEIRWMQSICTTTKDEKGKVTKLFGTAQDITKQKKVEAELIASEQSVRQKEEALRLSLDASRAGTWTWDVKTGEVFWDDQMQRIFGLEPGTFDGTFEGWKRQVHPEDVQLAEQTTLNALNSGDNYKFEYRVKGLSGDWRIINAQAATLVDEDGNPLRMSGLATDITDRKRIEEELKTSKDRLESLWNITKIADADIKTISDHVLAEIQKITESKYAFYGFLSDGEKTMVLHAWSRKTMADCRVSDKPLHFPIDKAGIWADAVREKRVVTLNDFPKKKQGRKGVPDGHVRLERVMAVPLVKEGKVISIAAVANKVAEYTQEDENQVQAFLGNVQILIERKETEEEKIDLMNRLHQAQKMESIGTLAGGIAHDFNNILSPVMIHSELIMQELPTDSSLQFNIEEIFKAAKRARDLVKQILTFSRKRTADYSNLKITPVLKETIKLLRSTTPTTIEIIQRIETERDIIYSDPTQIHQLILNLSTNAVHAMKEKGGILEIVLKDIRIDASNKAKFSELPLGDYLKLRVKDTGYGMDKATMENIFEPYFTTKGVGEGTGLGLAVAHGIVKDSGGDILVKSETGKGTVFDVLLPIIDSDVTEQVEKKPILARGSERVLFVDDELSAVNANKAMLLSLGYQVTTRTSSVEALELFRNNPTAFDLVITDMTMPNMTGKELSKELMSIRPDIPIILCTGFSEQINEDTAEMLGIRAFVMKPIVMRDIAQTIRRVLDLKV